MGETTATDAVNVTHLIRLVRERPVLWDRTMTELYKNRRMTQLAWRDICEQLVPDFAALAEHERKAAERSMMGKWANLRDNWLRYWRKRQDLLHSGAPLDSLRKYIHHDRMIFLSKVYDTDAWEEVEQIEVEVDLPSPESMSPLADETPEPCPPAPWDLSSPVNGVNPQDYMEWKRLAPNLIYRSSNVEEVPDLIPVASVISTNIGKVRINGETSNNLVSYNFPKRAPIPSPPREEISRFTASRTEITSSDLSEIKVIVGKLQQISDKLEKTTAEDSHDLFGKHVASLLRDLPASKVDSMKRKILKSLHHAKVSLDEQNLEEQNSQSVCSASPTLEPLTVCLRVPTNNEASPNRVEESNTSVSEAQQSSNTGLQEAPEAQPLETKRKRRKNRKQDDAEIQLPSPGTRRIIKKLKPYDV